MDLGCWNQLLEQGKDCAYKVSFEKASTSDIHVYEHSLQCIICLKDDVCVGPPCVQQSGVYRVDGRGRARV